MRNPFIDHKNYSFVREYQRIKERKRTHSAASYLGHTQFNKNEGFGKKQIFTDLSNFSSYNHVRPRILPCLFNYNQNENNNKEKELNWFGRCYSSSYKSNQKNSCIDPVKTNRYNQKQVNNEYYSTKKDNGNILVASQYNDEFQIQIFKQQCQPQDKQNKKEFNLREKDEGQRGIGGNKKSSNRIKFAQQAISQSNNIQKQHDKAESVIGTMINLNSINPDKIMAYDKYCSYFNIQTKKSLQKTLHSQLTRNQKRKCSIIQSNFSINTQFQCQKLKGELIQAKKIDKNTSRSIESKVQTKFLSRFYCQQMQQKNANIKNTTQKQKFPQMIIVRGQIFYINKNVKNRIPN